MKRALGGILKRKTELPTAIAIKSSRWGADDSLRLIKGIQNHKTPYQLHKDTVKTLQSHIQSFRNPLERYLGLFELSKVGDIDAQLEADMHAHYGFLEQAIVEGYTQLLDDSKIALLLSHGAAEEAVALILAGSYHLRPHIWNQVLQALILDKQYSLACEMWALNIPLKANIPDWTIRKLFILAANERDVEMLAQLEPMISNVPDKLLQTSLLDSLDDLPELLRALRRYPGTEGGSALLAHPDNLFLTLESVQPAEPSSVCNSILKGCFDRYTSLFVFAMYHYLQSTAGFQPDMTTAQILANACHRLGNSKMVSFAVWNHFVDKKNLTPDRKFCETLVRCQFNGTGVRTSLYYLYQMHKRGIHLRNSLHFQLIGTFGNDLTYTQLYSDMRKLEAFAEWDPHLAELESGRYQAQANRNCEAFDKTDRSIEELATMFEFEQQRYK